MLLANLPPFQRIPLEVRVELFSFLDQTTLKTLRVASRVADHAIRFGWLCNFRPWILSKNTAKFMLQSKVKVRRIEICNLRLEVCIPSDGCTLQYASEICVGSGISVKNLEKILDHVGSMRTLELDFPDEAVIAYLSISDNRFPHITTLDLILGNSEYERAFLESLANPKEQAMKFQSLRKFCFQWKVVKLTTRTKNNIQDIHSMYINLHKFIWLHRNTLQALILKLCTKFMLGLSAEAEESCANLFDMMSEVCHLKHIEIIPMMLIRSVQCSLKWSLSQALLKAQTQLTVISYKPLFISPCFSVGKRLLEEVIQANSKSLLKVEVPRIYPPATRFDVTCLKDCNLLTTLELPHTEYNDLRMATDNKPLVGITHLSIFFAGYFGEHRNAREVAEQSLDWVTIYLKNLKSLKITIKLLGIPKLKALMNDLPRLEVLEVISNSNVTVNYQYQWFVTACSKREGITAKLINRHSPEECCMEFRINRKIFKPFGFV